MLFGATNIKVRVDGAQAIVIQDIYSEKQQSAQRPREPCHLSSFLQLIKSQNGGFRILMFDLELSVSLVISLAASAAASWATSATSWSASAATSLAASATSLGSITVIASIVVVWSVVSWRSIAVGSAASAAAALSWWSSSVVVVASSATISGTLILWTTVVSVSWRIVVSSWSPGVVSWTSSVILIIVGSSSLISIVFTSSEAGFEATLASASSTSAATSAALVATSSSLTSSLTSPVAVKSLPLVVLLHLGVRDWLVADVGLVDVLALGEGDLEHGDNSAVLEVVETLVERLKLIDDGDVANLVDLVETLHSVLHELSEVHSRLNCVRDALDDNGVISALATVEELPGSLEVSANTHAPSNSNLVSWEGVLWLVYSSISFRHFYFWLSCV